MKDVNTFLRATGGRLANLQSKGRQTGSMVQSAGWLRAPSLSCTWMECIQQAGKGLADRLSSPHPFEEAPSSCSVSGWTCLARWDPASGKGRRHPRVSALCQACLWTTTPVPAPTTKAYLLICFLVSAVHPSSALELWSVYVAPGTEWLVLEAQRGRTQRDFQGKMDFRSIDINICRFMVFQTDHHLLLHLSFTRILEQEADSWPHQLGTGRKPAYPGPFLLSCSSLLPLWAEEEIRKTRDCGRRSALNIWAVGIISWRHNPIRTPRVGQEGNSILKPQELLDSQYFDGFNCLHKEIQRTELK